VIFDDADWQIHFASVSFFSHISQQESKNIFFCSCLGERFFLRNRKEKAETIFGESFFPSLLQKLTLSCFISKSIEIPKRFSK